MENKPEVSWTKNISNALLSSVTFSMGEPETLAYIEKKWEKCKFCDVHVVVSETHSWLTITNDSVCIGCQFAGKNIKSGEPKSSE